MVKHDAPSDAPHRMLTIEQVLEIVPVSRATLYRLIEQGRFPNAHYVTPRKRFWYAEEVTSWQQSLPTRALTQIIGKRSDHRMLASSPASILNHIRPKSGIPSDSINP